MQLREKRHCKCAEHRGDEKWHGSTRGYRHHACRCERCGRGQAESKRAYREANRATVLAREAAHREANRSARSQRAAEYRESNRELLNSRARASYAASPAAAKLRAGAVRRRLREATKAVANRDGLDWTPADDATVMRRDIGLVEMACILGRSHAAVVQRRSVIRKGRA